MARIGVSYPVYAKYNYDGENGVTYSGGGSMGKATEIDLDLNDTNNNVLYADNAPAESVNTFTGGTIGVGTDDLYDKAAIDMLGLETKELTTPEKVTEILEGETQQAPYIGIGYIIKHMRSGTLAWTGVVLTKVQMSIPGEQIETQGETIDWQTPTIEGSILRDDTEKHYWRRRATFSTEANAKAYINGILNITSAA